VDEADIIKTDGQYIYYMTSSSVNIVKSLTDGKLELASTITRKDDKTWFSDMYIQDNRLVLVGSANIYTILPAVKSSAASIDKSIIMPSSKQYTSVFVYDIGDKSKPTLTKSLELEGHSIDTRKIGNLVYLITQKYSYDTSANPSEYIPTYRDSANGNDIKTIEANKIGIMPNPVNASYLNIATIDISNDSASNIQSILGSGHIIYMNQQELYVAVNTYENDLTYTDVTRFELVGQSVVPKNTARVPGYVINQFAMDQYNGYFRIATSN
jgi:uncharacterized secreted protein with C-terminal beta-propeller domain